MCPKFISFVARCKETWLHMTVDYPNVNAVTRKDADPLPYVTLDTLAGSKRFRISSAATGKLKWIQKIKEDSFLHTQQPF